MFKIQLIIGGSLLASIAVLITFTLLYFQNSDHLAYQALLESSHPLNEELFSQHSRDDVSKEIWYQKDTPLHFRIESPNSKLVFSYENNQLNIVEQFGALQCTIQEELYYLLPDGREAAQQKEGKWLIRGEDPANEEAWILPSLPGLIPMQMVRYLEAERGCYIYKSQELTAEKVIMWEYRLKGHDAISALEEYTPLMQAHAQHVELSLKGEKSTFQAHRVRANFNSLQRLAYAEETTIESKEAYYDGDKITLIGDLFVNSAMGQVRAEQATLIRDETKTTSFEFPWIELEKDVSFVFPHGGKVSCEQLFLNRIEMTALFIGTPVTYVDPLREIVADQSHVDYIKTDGEIQPTKIVLKGNVRLMTHEPVVQYALADQVAYFPQKELLILEGKENRVLFYDQSRDMRLSARTVHAMRDQETKKESIQGIGEVRFVFGPEELGRLQEQFQYHDLKS